MYGIHSISYFRKENINVKIIYIYAMWNQITACYQSHTVIINIAQPNNLSYHYWVVDWMPLLAFTTPSYASPVLKIDLKSLLRQLLQHSCFVFFNFPLFTKKMNAVPFVLNFLLKFYPNIILFIFTPTVNKKIILKVFSVKFVSKVLFKKM